MFESFSRELAKYDEGVHRLCPSVSETALHKAEKELGFSLPGEYRAFLQLWNGGLLFAKEFYDILLWSVADEHARAAREYECDVVRMNRELMAEHGHPLHLLGIASYSDGNLLCLDMNRDGRPVLWLRCEESIEQEWDGLADWLAHEMEEGTVIYDYHGDELD